MIHQKYIIVDNHSGEEAVNHDGTPVKLVGNTVTMIAYWPSEEDNYTTVVQDLGEDRFYLEAV